MKVLVVEDNAYKREDIIRFLNKKNIEFEVCEYVNDSLRFILKNEKQISGIILDLGLQTSKDSNDYNLYNGLDVIYELNRKRMDIPILINSETLVNMSDRYPFVWGQRTQIGNYQMLEEFVAFLTEKEKQ